MTSKILFGNLKHHLLPLKNKNYLKYLKEIHPDKEPHHILGSQGKLKLTDYLVVMVTREEHIEAEKHKIEFFFNNLYRSLNHLFSYIDYLEKSSN